jgi:thioredoxin-like negative regulator of GroEL
VKDNLPAIDFLKINVRTNPKVSTSFRVEATPLVLILQNGKEIWRQANTFSVIDLRRHLNLMDAKNEVKFT